MKSSMTGKVDCGKIAYNQKHKRVWRRDSRRRLLGCQNAIPCCFSAPKTGEIFVGRRELDVLF